MCSLLHLEAKSLWEAVRAFEEGVAGQVCVGVQHNGKISDGCDWGHWN
jgi:hypothetical protein